MLVLEASPAERAAAEAYWALCEQVVRAVNHDLRTPLTSLLSHTELLLEEEGLPTSAQRSLAAMQRAGQAIKDRLCEMAGSLDVPHRPPTGRVTVDISTLVRGVVGQLERSCSGTGVTLEVTSPDDLVVVVDATLLTHAILEMLHHALDVAPGGSTVGLSVRVEGGEVCVDVRDEGPGLRPSDRDRLTAALAAGGSYGRLQLARLGLVVASSVAVAHGGRVVLSSPEGGGSTASLRLDLRTVAV